ncbi:hypothetical protein CR513_40569, partial [Mucuna pruriens]
MKYNILFSYKTTKDMWDDIQITYEGIKDVQLRKATTLMRHYEMFTMKKEGTIDEMFGRIQTILNGLNSLGHEFSTAQNNLKILDSFSKVWEPKSTIIQEAHNIRSLTLDALHGALRVFEAHLKRKEKLAEKDLLTLNICEPSSKKTKEKYIKAEICDA